MNLEQGSDINPEQTATAEHTAKEVEEQAGDLLKKTRDLRNKAESIKETINQQADLLEQLIEAEEQAGDLLEKTGDLRAKAESIKINFDETINQQADLTEQLIKERTELGPQIKECVEKAQFLQNQKNMPGVDEEERHDQLIRANDAVINLQESADALEDSIDALAGNPYIKKELGQRAGLTDKVKSEIKSNQEHQADQQLVQEIKENYKQQINETAKHVVELQRLIYRAQFEQENLKYNTIRHNRSSLLEAVRQSVNQHFKKKKQSAASDELRIENSESGHEYAQRMSALADQQKGWGKGDYRKALDEIINSEALKTLQSNEDRLQQLNEKSFDTELNHVGAEVEALLQELHDNYTDKINNPRNMQRVLDDVKYTIGAHLHDVGLGQAEESQPWYDEILQRPGIQTLLEK